MKRPLETQLDSNGMKKSMDPDDMNQLEQNIDSRDMRSFPDFNALKRAIKVNEAHKEWERIEM